ncbi:MAG: hypothetical protein A2X05_10700 [Bacteroidetes bacterium GWE2_41_25]|nr:MAG: hypothetical protein A2X05_10700 [Bacteroidetes bacterium GWE2_41_25]OFX99779.1 MAG: hypothetical protein A2X06_11470 [Bacteroidetes bacterium GWC2_40_22]OFY61472.1 MAG: hypothetical protein A2X04_12875 [Bacteroidetes bacterium GWF2_41_9]HBQ82196.1 hypothetical protein [Bacteroidales bacterium]HCU19485.1 hypothetical protein [Bacteroidales bacterium]
MNPQLAEIKSATERKSETLNGVITALEKYTAACTKACTTLSNDLANCKDKLNPKPKPPKKK